MERESGNKLLDWHKGLAQVTGAISLSVLRRSVGRATLLDWAARLERIAKEIREKAGDRGGGSGQRDDWGRA